MRRHRSIPTKEPGGHRYLAARVLADALGPLFKDGK